MQRNLRQNMLNDVDLHKLLIKYKVHEVALVFGVTKDYVYKTERLQKIQSPEKPQIDEMKLGRRGAWTLSKARNYMERNFLLEKQNKWEKE